MDIELNRIESELHAEESALHAEAQRLALQGQALAARATALRLPEEDAAVMKTLPAVIEPEVMAARARAVRESAVKTRREMNAQVRKAIAETKAQLTRFTQQVMDDEQAAKKARAAPAPVVAPPAFKASKPVDPPRPQRLSPRVRMMAAIDFSSDANFYQGFSANISEGGLFVATVNLVPLGTEVDLSFSLPSGDRIDAKGVVRWVREVNDKLPDAFPGMGVEFVNLAPQAQESIDAFIAQRDPLFFVGA